mmetsp:Transcript_10615/g.32629  ORF Transcript_10615/g.32629 Transcript_10615/m.32629 type:complete len:228 (+) Transcript_10615:692-1375(+)
MLGRSIRHLSRLHASSSGGRLEVNASTPASSIAFQIAGTSLCAGARHTHTAMVMLRSCSQVTSCDVTMASFAFRSIPSNPASAAIEAMSHASPAVLTSATKSTGCPVIFSFIATHAPREKDIHVRWCARTPADCTTEAATSQSLASNVDPWWASLDLSSAKQCAESSESAATRSSCRTCAKSGTDSEWVRSPTRAWWTSWSVSVLTGRQSMASHWAEPTAVLSSVSS